MVDLRDRLKKAADSAELHARHGQDVDKRFDEGDKVIVLDDDAAGKLREKWQDPATVVCITSPHSYFIDIGDGRVRHVYTRLTCKCNFHVNIQSCDIISENDVDYDRIRVPAIAESDVLPDGSVDRGRVEHLDLGQQGELIDEFAACVSDEPVLCRVSRMSLLFVFLVCEVVKFICFFGTTAVRGKGRLDSCVRVLCYCCVQSYVNSHSAILCLVCVCVLFAFIWSRVSTAAWCNVPIVRQIVAAVFATVSVSVGRG